LDNHRGRLVEVNQFGNQRKSPICENHVVLFEDCSFVLTNVLQKFKDVFAWTYKDLKGIIPKIAQHCIELDTSIPPTHQAWYFWRKHTTVTPFGAVLGFKVHIV